jgi:L-carnitine CoA-transferase
MNFSAEQIRGGRDSTMPKGLQMPIFGNLQGLRVAFSGIEVAGPWGAQMMAEWGADVTWIEHVAYDDQIRLELNYCELDRRNQRNLSLNIFSEEGREVFLKLIETVDIFIESSKGPAFARRGITDELMWEHNKSLVIVHLSGFGQSGVEEIVNRASYDLIAQAFSGYLIQNGDVDQPIPAFPYAGDYMAAFMVLGSSLAALYHTQKTGVGESIDVAMHEVMLRVGQFYMMDYLNGGKAYPRSSKGKDPIYVGCGVYKCKDNFIGLELQGPKQVKSMLNLLGMSHLLGTEDYPEGIPLIRTDSPAGPAVDEKLDEYFASKTADEAEKDLNQYAIPAGKVMTFEDIVNHPHYAEREDFIEWETLEGKKCKGPNVFPKFKNNPGQVWRPMPKRGMDTEDILSDLGYSSEQIRDLNDKGVIVMTENR